MSTQSTCPGEDELDDDMKRILDEHVAAAGRDTETVSREQILDGIFKLKHPAPQ